MRFHKKDLSKTYNVGDAVCTPDVYFVVECAEDVEFIGGGVWDVEKLSTHSNARRTVLWGAGRSIRRFYDSSMIADLKFLQWGIRDLLDLSDKSKFLPCVSCLDMEILAPPISDKTLVFTNANKTVSSEIHKKRPEHIYMTNDASRDQLLEAWRQCDKIITNSYHGIYWGLLSGREVCPYGYSSKFVNVVALFGLQFPETNLYHVVHRHSLSEMLSRPPVFIRCQDHENVLDTFRSLNCQFAESLLRHEIRCEAKQ